MSVQNWCMDCGSVPKARGMVTWEDDNGVEHTTTCTSTFHVIVKREAGAYEYLTEKLDVLHTTSVPMTDQEALEYFSFVQEWFPNEDVKFITRRELDGKTFEMMDFFWDRELKEARPIAEL